MLAIAAAALLGLGAVVLAIAANDDATVEAPVLTAPGTPTAQRPPHAADVARGNVVLAPLSAQGDAAARRLAREIAGPDSPALRAAGQAVIVEGVGAPPSAGTDVERLGTSTADCRDRSGATVACPAVVAYAHGRFYAAKNPGDVQLRAFVAYWLGRAG